MTGRGRPTRVYIVEDSLTIRALLETLIGLDTRFEICGTAALAETALDDLDKARPDILLLDLMLPGLDGISFLKLAGQHWRPFDLIVISSSTKQGCFTSYQCLRFGALACFDKSKLVTHAAEFITLMSAAAERAETVRLRPDTAVTLPSVGLPRLDAMHYEGHFGIAPLAAPPRFG